jgi:uncharacterized SAM-binding protein YcdF (DUF218 family)
MIKALLLPPLNFLLLAAIGFGMHRRRPLRRALIGASFAGLFLVSLPIVADLALWSLETAPPAAPDPAAAEAIVVLAGDAANAAEYGGATVGALTLERIRYAAQLQRRVGKPILASGGAVTPVQIPLATLMRAALIGDFGVPDAMIETTSRDTAENARNSAVLLREAGIGRIWLVTHAWHMRRAQAAFERHGIVVIPAPTRGTQLDGLAMRQFVPTANAQLRSYYAAHESLGIVWYALVAWLWGVQEPV